MKFNRLNIYLRDNGTFDVDAHFDTTNIEKAYRRFVDIFLQAATDIPALKSYNHFPHAKKLIQNTNGWENELGDQIFFKEANDCLCVDLNEDNVYIFGKFNRHTTAPVAEPQPELIADKHEETVISADQPVDLKPASPLVDVDADISTGEEITLTQRADRIRSLQADVQRGITKIGFELIAAKEQVGHGNWQSWLADEFHWTIRTAQNFMNVAQRFGSNYQTFGNLSPSTLINMLALSEGDEEEFIATQAAAGKPVEKQSAREVQKNVKAFKQLRASKKLPDDDKLPTLQGLSLPFDESNDTLPESSVTIVPKTSDVLHDDRTDLPYEETDDTPVFVDHDVTSDTLPAVDSIPASINALTGVGTNLVITPAQVTAVRELIAKTDDLNKLKVIRDSLANVLLFVDSKITSLAD